MIALLNNVLRRFGAEIHGVGYMQKLKNSSVDKSEWKRQKEYLPNASTIFDVGAHIGQTSQAYRSFFPKATIHAFEPFPDNCAQFRENLKGDAKVVLNAVGLSGKKGRATLNVNRTSGTHSLLETTTIGATSDKSCETVGQTEIETTTADAYCKEKGIESIDILKIDVQGSEVAVLTGAVAMLRAGRIKLVYTECYFKQQYVNQPLFHDISKFLYGYGFQLQDIYDPYYSTSGILLWSDAIFLHKDFF